MALKVGSTTITATCGTVSATCVITVEAIESTDIILNYSTASIKMNQTLQLAAVVYPVETTDQTVTWSSSQPNVATVENGLVSPVSVGTTIITASNGNISATCEVTVEPVLAEQVIIEESAVSVNAGSAVTLTASVYPDDVTDKTLTWISQNDEIATVADGVVTGVKPGTTVVTASSGNVFASCTVTVLQPATSISLNVTSLEMKVGDIYDLIETVSPEDTTDAVVWKSSDESIAVVDQNGIITALKPGSVTITATCGSVSAECVVSINDNDFSALQDISTDNFDGYYRVSNLQGVQVLITKDSTAIGQLPAGIYIINGRKVAIK